MNCSELAPLLLARALDVAERPAEVDAHVAGCDACRTLAQGRVAVCLDALRLPASSACSDGWEALAARVEAHRGRQQLKIALTCAYCHAELERVAAAFCASCLAPHHDECFTEHGRCSAPGCAEVRVVRPGQPTRPRRRWAPWVTFAGGLAVAAAALSPSMPRASTRSPDAAAPSKWVTVRIVDETALVTVRCEDEDVRKVVSEVAAAGGRDLVLPPDFQGTVTLDLADVHYLRAIFNIARSVGDFELVEESTKTLRIVNRASIPAQKATELYILKHTTGEQARTLLRLLTEVIAQRRSEDPDAVVALDERSNTIVLTTSDLGLRRELRALLEERDAPR